MLISILSLTYMLVIIIIQMAWIDGITKSNGKCRYKDCNHCPYNGSCPMQEGRNKHERKQ